MEFRVPYVTAMRQQAPKMFNRLTRSGELEAHLNAKCQEASQMFADLTKDAPKETGGYPREPEATEAAEQVRAVLIEFPENEQTTRQTDERNAMLNRPQVA